MYPLFDQIFSACVSEVDQCLELAGVSCSSIPLMLLSRSKLVITFARSTFFENAL